ncbi:hypothetical protein ACH5RR_021180 [Cinchona calisaya]|uniref:Transmembrane protein n=1 Tax=Cinchona calisaya TaxID=153742 RepID=A0ABD2ZID2_9GENT
MMATVVLKYVQNIWPLSILKDDLRVSNRLVKKLPIPESTKKFVYAVQEAESGSVIYVLCVQNLSERSALDAECLIKAVKPDAVVAQVGPSIEGNEFLMDAIASEVCNSSGGSFSAKCSGRRGNEFPVPTSAFEVLKRCFLHKVNKEKFENVAGSLVLKEIFGVGFNGHFSLAKRAAEEVGASFLLLESPFVKCSADGKCSLEMVEEEEVEQESGNRLRALGMQPTCLVSQNGRSSMVSMSLRRFSAMDDVQFRMVKSLSLELSNSSSVLKANSEDVEPRVDYEAPQFSQSIYPLLVDLHDIFVDIPHMGRALAHSQDMLSAINEGETVDTQLLSEVHVFRIAVEGLRIALNDAGRLPINKLGNPLPSKCEFAELPVQEKSHALLAQALQSQTTRFKSIVALVDANGLAGLRKHWNTRVPAEVKNMVEQLVTDYGNDRKIQNHTEKVLLSAKPTVAVGAGATAVLGVSSLSKVVPASTFVKILTFKVPASVKLMMTQTYKIVTLTFGKTVGPSKVVAPGMASGVKASVLKAAASAEKIRAVAHSIIACAEKTSLSAMRTAFYEIMRKRHVKPIGFLPWATFGCSIATCTGLLMYGDGIECAVESVPAAPSIASLGRGIQSLHQASQAVQQAESSPIQKSIESLLHRFRRIKVQS